MSNQNDEIMRLKKRCDVLVAEKAELNHDLADADRSRIALQNNCIDWENDNFKKIDEIKQLESKLFRTKSRLAGAIGMLMWHDDNKNCGECNDFIDEAKKFLNIGQGHSAKIGDEK